MSKTHTSTKSQTRIWASVAIIAAASLILINIATDTAAQKQSGLVVEQAEHRSAYDAYMKVNRLKEAPSSAEDMPNYWAGLETRLMNQAGRVLIKRPDPGFSEDAFYGWLDFFATYGGESGVGNCIECHRPGEFTDGKEHNIGTGGSFATPSLREAYKKKSFLHDGSAKTIAEAIKAHDASKSGADEALKSINLNDEEVDRVAEMLATMKPVDADAFRDHLINVVIIPYEFDF